MLLDNGVAYNMPRRGMLLFRRVDDLLQIMILDDVDVRLEQFVADLPCLGAWDLQCRGTPLGRPGFHCHALERERQSQTSESPDKS